MIGIEATAGYPAMREAAKRLGFSLSPEDPGMSDFYDSVVLTGDYDGARVSIERNAGLMTFRTRMLLRKELPCHLVITRESLVSKVGHLVGIHDVEIGDPAFDKAFRLVTDSVDVVRKVLTPKVKELLKGLWESGCDFRLTEQQFAIDRFYVRGAITVDDVMADLPFSAGLTVALENAVDGKG